MTTFKNKLNMWVDDEFLQRVDKLIENNPEYESRSQVIRVAVIKLHRQEIKE